MNWEAIISIVPPLLMTGGVIYLIVEKLFDRRREKAEVKRIEVEMQREAAESSVPMLAMYEEIRKIVAKETDPIQEKLDKALERIDTLEKNYCCFREGCEMRIRNEKDAMRDEVIESIDVVADYFRNGHK